MLFQQSNRTNGEKVFIVCRNTSGGTISAGAPVFFETDEVSDGNAVSQASASEQFALFAGIANDELLDNAHGLVQTYGVYESAFVSAASAGSEVGLALIPVAGQDYLTDSTSSGRHDWNFVNLMETVAADAANSGVLPAKVFIRAL